MTNEKELRESLGKEIMTEIDFLCDHWIEHDNKSPYKFGGWRGEVQEKLVDIYLSKLHSHTKEVVENIKGMRKEIDVSQPIDGVYKDIGFNQAIDYVVTSLEDKTPKKTAGTWKGKELNEMSKEELIKALEDLNNLYLTALEDNKK